MHNNSFGYNHVAPVVTKNLAETQAKVAAMLNQITLCQKTRQTNIDKKNAPKVILEAEEQIYKIKSQKREIELKRLKFLGNRFKTV